MSDSQACDRLLNNLKGVQYASYCHRRKTKHWPIPGCSGEAEKQGREGERVICKPSISKKNNNKKKKSKGHKKISYIISLANINVLHFYFSNSS